MRSSSREEIVEVFDALEAGFKRALDLRCDALTTPEHLAVLERCERIRRWLPAIEHPVINQLSDQADPAEVGGKLAQRWPTGCASPEPKRRGASTKPPIWASDGRSTANRCRRCCLPPPTRSATATSGPATSR